MIRAILEDIDVQLYWDKTSVKNKINSNYLPKFQTCGSQYVVFQWLPAG